MSARTAALPGAAATERRRAARRSGSRWDLRAYLYLAVPFAFVAVFVLWPIVQTAQYSLYTWDGIGPAVWAGFDNYVRVATSGWFGEGLGHVGVLILFFSALPIAAGLVLAAASGRKRGRGTGVFESLIFLPQVVTPVVVALSFGAIYATGGVLNGALRGVGLGALARPWLGEFEFALPAIGLIGTWVATGLCFVLFRAGISAIDPQLYDAAKVDGASPIREFFAVTLPGLRGQLTIALTITVTGAVRTFDTVYVLTGGGPGTSTSVPAFQIFNLAFKIGEVGTGSAVAVILSVLIIGLSLLIGLTAPKEDVE